MHIALFTSCAFAEIIIENRTISDRIKRQFIISLKLKCFLELFRFLFGIPRCQNFTFTPASDLFKVLEIFAKENINLTRIESLPNQKGSFAFFLDFLGSKTDAKVQKTLKSVKSITVNFRLMGCYNEIKVA